MNHNEIQALGASLRRINQKLLKTDQTNKIVRVWYQGDEPYFDIFFDLKDDEVVWFQFTLRSQSLTWEKGKPGFKTGLTHENQIEGTNYPASKLIETQRQVDREFVELAYAILKTRADEDPFAQILQWLSQAL